jgi:hypothetical protein
MGDELCFNGIGGMARLSVSPLTAQDLSALARGEVSTSADRRVARQRQESHYGVKEGDQSLSQTGWGVIFARNNPAIRGRSGCWRPGRPEDATGSMPASHTAERVETAFLARHGAGPGPADRTGAICLLIVGDRRRFPTAFSTRSTCSMPSAHYFDSLEEYAQYAQRRRCRSGQIAARRARSSACRIPTIKRRASAQSAGQPLADELAQDQRTGRSARAARRSARPA